MLYVIVDGKKRRVYEKDGRFYIFVRNQKNVDRKDVIEQATPPKKVAVKSDLNKALQYNKELSETIDKLQEAIDTKERQIIDKDNTIAQLKQDDSGQNELRQKYEKQIQQIIARGGLSEQELKKQLAEKEREYTSEIERLQSECADKVKQLERSHQEDISQAGANREQLDRDYSDKVAVQLARILELEQALQEAVNKNESIINNLETTHNEIMSRYRQLGKERDELLKEKARLEDELSRVQVSTVENLGQYNDCTDRINELNNEIRDLRRQIRDMPTEIEELRDLLERTTKERDELQTRLGEFVTKGLNDEDLSGIEQLEREFVRAKGELVDKLQKCNDLLSACEVDVESKDAEVERLNKQNSEMVKKYNKLVEEAAKEIEEEVVEKSSNDNRAIIKDLSDCNSKYDELKAVHTEMEDEHSKTFKEVLQLRKTVEKLTEENEIFRNVIEEALSILSDEDKEKLVNKLTRT